MPIAVLLNKDSAIIKSLFCRPDECSETHRNVGLQLHWPNNSPVQEEIYKAGVLWEYTGKLLSKWQVRRSEYSLYSLAWEDNILGITCVLRLANAFSAKSSTMQCSNYAISKYTKHFYGTNNNTTVQWCPHKKTIHFNLRKYHCKNKNITSWHQNSQYFLTQILLGGKMKPRLFA